MRAFIRHLGVVDHDDRVHAVSFSDGVNVVTGRSSTGKSALIEIFDFCFGSSDFTVPEGVITAHAEIFFVALRLKETTLVLGRRRSETKAFLKEERDLKIVEGYAVFNRAYFDGEYFKPLEEFKKEVGRYCGLIITDVDEDEATRAFTGRKSSTPSIRSFTSFMLQHQNLVANKHAVFYRFDEKEKREQAIEHFKIFAGFADQTYFLKSQELNKLISTQRRLELLLPRDEEAKKSAENRLETSLLEYLSISGHNLGIQPKDAVKHPKKTLDALRNLKVVVVPLSDEHAALKSKLEEEKTQKVSALRRLHHKLGEVRSSIKFARKYVEDAEGINVPSEADLKASTCPFCDQPHLAVEKEANRLSTAIGWLNTELARSPYILDSFEEMAKKLGAEIARTSIEIQVLEDKSAAIDAQISDLERLKTQYELTLESKFRVEKILEEFISGKESDVKRDLERVRREITDIREYIKKHYDIDAKIGAAEKYIEDAMAEIGSRFDFEFKPINLRFSLKTFDLWHESAGKKVFLRSMGSGANWLYCHVTLFLALHRYFCSLGDRCAIPTILFLDQPSQVYFPSSVNDIAAEFSLEELAKQEGGAARKRPVDDDIRAVTELYNELLRYCADTEKLSGFKPQIIVTDHADHLKLANGVLFDDLVSGRRWRTRGLIHPVSKHPFGQLEEGPKPDTGGQ